MNTLSKIFERTKERKLLSFQSSNSSFNYMEEKVKRNTLYSYPRQIDFGLTQNCNVRCIMCGKDKVRYEDMSFDLFKKIVDEVCPWVANICFVGWGENTVHPEFEKMLEYILRKGKKSRFSIVTNGLEINQSLMKTFISEFEFLQFSINANSPSLHKEIMPSINHERVLSNISDLLALRREKCQKKPKFIASFTAMKRNLEELPGFIESYAKLGFDSVNIQFLQVKSPEMANESLSDYPKRTQQIIQKSWEAAKKYNIACHFLPEISDFDNKTDLLDLKKNEYINKQSYIYCSNPWRNAYIEATGDLYLCCYSSLSPIGNLKNNSFKEIWNNDFYRMVRKRINSNNPPQFCKNCIMRNS